MSVHGGRIGGQYTSGKPLKLWEKVFGTIAVCVAIPFVALCLMIRSLTRPHRGTQ